MILSLSLGGLALAAVCLAVETWAERKAQRREERVRAFAELVAEVRRYEVDGVSLRVVDEYRAPLTEAECEQHQRVIGFGLLAVYMAQRCERPAPMQARA